MRLFSNLIIIMLSSLLFLQCGNKEKQVWTDTIKIKNRKLLSMDAIPAQRIPLGIPDDYKPCIARLPDDELLLVAFQQHELGGTRKSRS